MASRDCRISRNGTRFAAGCVDHQLHDRADDRQAQDEAGERPAGMHVLERAADRLDAAGVA
jgi:hypothetical protein